MEYTVNNLEELIPVSKEILKHLKHKIILFEGDLGAGKTTFIKTLLKSMGSEEEVSSPTFSIVNEYQSPKGKIYHFDLYRIKSEIEALDFGMEEYLDSGYYCLIEWPDKIESLLPTDFHQIKIISSNNQRTIYFL